LKQIRRFALESGRVPFDEWIDRQEIQVRAKIYSYVDRVARGATSNVKRLSGSEGVLEITIDWGPGYRVYFGEVENSIILLLVAGVKKDQIRDIELARRYWRLYNAKASFIRRKTFS
jgi:putative addiction module killer protein